MGRKSDEEEKPRKSSTSKVDRKKGSLLPWIALFSFTFLVKTREIHNLTDLDRAIGRSARAPPEIPSGDGAEEGEGPQDAEGGGGAGLLGHSRLDRLH